MTGLLQARTKSAKQSALSRGAGNSGVRKRVHDDRHGVRRSRRGALRCIRLKSRKKLTQRLARAAAGTTAGIVGCGSVVMMMAALAAAYGLSNVLNVGELTASRGVAEIGRQLVQLARSRGIPTGRSGLGGVLQVGRDLLRHLCVLGWVRLLKLLERAHQLSEWGKLAIVRLRGARRCSCVVGQADALQRCAENRL
jgi:hypothetical protein